MQVVQMASWFSTPGWFGFSYGAWILFAVGVIVEYLLGRSKNPRFRSLAQAIATALSSGVMLVTRRLPVIGPLALAVVETVSPSGTRCPHCDGRGQVRKKKEPTEKPATTPDA